MLASYFVILLWMVLGGVDCGLYDESKYVTRLSNDTWQQIYGSDKIWAIEFYTTWCGYCQHFAPVWNKVGVDAKDWRNVRVAAIDCGEDVNAVICRDFGISMYPSIKMLGPNAETNDTGMRFTLSSAMQLQFISEDYDYNIIDDYVRSTFIRYAEIRANKTGDSSIIEPIKPFTGEDLESVNDIFNSTTYKEICLVFGDKNNYLGKQISLDFQSCNESTVMAVSGDSGLVLANKFSLIELPVVVCRSKTHNKTTNLVLKNTTRSDIKEAVLEHFKEAGLDMELCISPEVDMGSADAWGIGRDSTNEHMYKVYMVDLENALWYSLNHEIAGKLSISGHDLETLKKFLTVLVLYFPGREPVMKYLTSVKDHIDTIEEEISGANFSESLQAMLTETEYLPKQQEWAGCKGTLPKYRRYPCSMWMLFHSLTVSSLSDPPENSTMVLEAVAGYMENFFSCRECSDNFQEMARNETEGIHIVTSLKESVMWLWNHHNHVNERLANDVSEDPKHIKVQFPSTTMCETCSKDGIFDEEQVYSFLKEFYSKDNFNYDWVYDKELDDFDPDLEEEEDASQEEPINQQTVKPESEEAVYVNPKSVDGMRQKKEL